MFNSIVIPFTWSNISSILGDSIQPMEDSLFKPQICFASQASYGKYEFWAFLRPKISSPSYPVRTVMFLFDSLTTSDHDFAVWSSFNLQVGNDFVEVYGKNYVFSL